MTADTTARTARRRTLRIAAAALTAAAALSLTACSGSDAAGTKPAAHADTSKAAADSSGAGSAGSGDAGSSAGAQDVDAKAGPGAKTGAKTGTKPGAAATQSGGAHAAGGGGGAGSGVERCHTSGLKASFATGGDAAPDPDADGPTTTSVVLTNKGSRACRIGGFAGVDLKSENGGERWSLARSSAKHGSITLGPGDSTDFTINLLMTKEDEGFYQPAFADITPPNETTSLTIKWPWGTLVDQRAATHPGTFVNPIG
ncbi:DUF4232 domain-containing protein [Streptomyces sp. NPDC021749]|uniref:DUF4232 domain-containing protein n=1 Tax=Streptomyces sp. NPDC021749 TaxID=3154905 RepID=UPI0033ED1911